MAAEYLERMGARIAARREELGLTQEDIARELPGKVTGQRVSLWERGKHRPRDDSLEALARILQVDVSYFMAQEPDKSSTPNPFPASDGDIAARLVEVEAKLDGLDKALREASAERVDLVDQILALLKEQSELLDMIRALVAGLGVPDGLTLQDHLAQLVRDTAVRSAEQHKPQAQS